MLTTAKVTTETEISFRVRSFVDLKTTRLTKFNLSALSNRYRMIGLKKIFCLIYFIRAWFFWEQWHFLPPMIIKTTTKTIKAKMADPITNVTPKFENIEFCVPSLSSSLTASSIADELVDSNPNALDILSPNSKSSMNSPSAILLNSWRRKRVFNGYLTFQVAM